MHRFSCRKCCDKTADRPTRSHMHHADLLTTELRRRCLRRNRRPAGSTANGRRSAGGMVAGVGAGEVGRGNSAGKGAFAGCSAARSTARPASVICHPASDRTTRCWPNRSSPGTRAASRLIRSVQSLPLVLRMFRSAFRAAIVANPWGWQDSTFRIAICNDTRPLRTTGLPRRGSKSTRSGFGLSSGLAARRRTIAKFNRDGIRHAASFSGPNSVFPAPNAFRRVNSS